MRPRNGRPAGRHRRAHEQPRGQPTKVREAGLDQAKAMSCLDDLVPELAKGGWSVRRRSSEGLPRLHVFDAQVPVCGDCITIVTDAVGALWYRSSNGRLLAPTTQPARAALEINLQLAPLVSAVLNTRTER